MRFQGRAWEARTGVRGRCGSLAGGGGQPRGCERGSAADHTLERSLLLRAVTASMVVNLSVLPFLHLEMASKVHLQQFLPLKWEEMGS